MWVFLNDAMLSIVQDRDDPSMMVVRARAKGDIAKVFPGTQEISIPGSDYSWRAWIARETVAEALVNEVNDIDYTNFKNSINKADKTRHDAYLDVWQAMFLYQRELERNGNPIQRSYGHWPRH